MNLQGFCSPKPQEYRLIEDLLNCSRELESEEPTLQWVSPEVRASTSTCSPLSRIGHVIAEGLGNVGELVRSRCLSLGTILGGEERQSG